MSARKFKTVFYGLVVTASVVLVVWLTVFKTAHRAAAPGQHTTISQASSPQATVKNTDVKKFDLHSYTTDQPGSLWWIVNKTRPLNPATYAPDDLTIPQIPLRVSAGDSEMRLRKEPALALEQLVQAAKKEKINLMLASGYRSYQLQVAVYNANVQKYGQAGADKQSARPGTSEHQTGLAADLEPTTKQCEVEQCFGDLPEGKWLVANAYKHGFVIRYPENKEKITGYEYEPWHIRYVGIDLSTEMHTQSTPTLEEFFNLTPDHQPY